MTYPLRIPDQLKPHLRALRKSRGLTQAQLGALVGVKQARIAEIEANPGAVGMDQLTKVLAALGGTLQLHVAAADPAVAPDAPDAPRRRPSSTVVASRASGRGAPSSRRAKPPPEHDDKLGTRQHPDMLRAGVVIRAKKGVW